MKLLKVIVPLTAIRMTNYTDLNVEFKDEFNGLQVSDGDHTMDELYEHRCALFVALLKIYDNYITPMNTRVKCWKSSNHEDDTMFEGWFIAGMTIQQITGPPKYITYHLPIEYWNEINVMILPNAPKWDGHTSKDVLKTLREL